MSDRDRLLASVLGHPWVAVAEFADPGAGVLRVRPTDAAVAARPRPGPLLREHLEHWSQVYDFIYGTGQDRHADDLDLSGWRASDTGNPFPRQHMLEWIDRCVGLVMCHQPSVVLELGCGSGLLAHRLLPRVDTYVGTDVAEEAVERLRRQLPGARIGRAAAHEARSDVVAAMLTPDGASGPVRPDCVVLNSVTECFPNEDYLAAVVHDALDLVAPGGRVIVGDVRNLASLNSFARWVERARGTAEAELAARAERRAGTDEELVCDPRLFRRLAEHHPRQVRVTCHAKTMRADTELTRYRYDVTLSVDAPEPGSVPTVCWAELSGHDRLDTARQLLEHRPTMITGIPHALLGNAHDGCVHPAELAPVLPRDCAVQLDAVDGSLLAAGPAVHRVPLPANQDDGVTELANDPFARFVAHRLPEILADRLEIEVPGVEVPAIVVDDSGENR